MKPNLISILESMIFVSQDPLPRSKLGDLLEEFSEAQINKALDELLERYSAADKGIHISQAGGGYRLVTNPANDSWIKRLLNLDRKGKLSPAAMETLSTIAYHQPITLAEISALRGVDATHSLKTLLQKKLVKITGRRKSPGKPLIYRTSEKFLTYFGLDSINDLPSKEEIAKILDEEEHDEEK